MWGECTLKNIILQIPGRIKCLVLQRPWTRPPCERTARFAHARARMGKRATDRSPPCGLPPSQSPLPYTQATRKGSEHLRAYSSGHPSMHRTPPSCEAQVPRPEREKLAMRCFPGKGSIFQNGLPAQNRDLAPRPRHCPRFKPNVGES